MKQRRSKRGATDGETSPSPSHRDQSQSMVVPAGDHSPGDLQWDVPMQNPERRLGLARQGGRHEAGPFDAPGGRPSTDTGASALAPAETQVADAILQILEAEGVEYIFGVPGGPLTGLFEAMHRRQSIRLVLAKHEAGAAFMAAAYARVRRCLAVCCGTSGPGATNALTGIASAYADCLPVLLLTGQVATSAFGKGAIQESSAFGTDIVDLFRSVTKLSAMLPSAER